MRLILRLLKWLGIGIAALCVLGFGYQLIGSALDAKYAPPPKDMIAVDGHQIHFACRGEGRRTYLLDAGAGVGAFEWGRLVPLLAKSGRVCAFDRPGLGWSDDVGDAHDVTTFAAEIGAFVRAAGIARPFVYVGHSLGANDAIVYRDRFPRDVAALILIEPGRPADLLEDFHGTREQAMTAPECGIGCVAAEGASWLGIPRLASHLVGAGAHNLSPEMRGEYLAELARPAETRAIVATLFALPKSGYEVMDVKSFDDTPVLILASSDPRKRESDETEAAFAQWQRDQRAYFAALAKMSTRGKGPVIVANTNHATMVMSERGAADVSTAIAAFLDANGQ